MNTTDESIHHKTPIDIIAPNPKRIRLDEPAADQPKDREEEEEASGGEDPLSEDGADGDAPYEASEGTPVPVSDSLMADGGHVSPEGEDDETKMKLPNVPLSRIKVLLKSAYPRMQVGKLPLEAIKDIALSITMEFVAGTIQQKVWDVNDPRYLEGAHMKLTKEDGLTFLAAHANENPWGLFAATENWQSLKWSEDTVPAESGQKPAKALRPSDQPPITRFFKTCT